MAPESAAANPCKGHKHSTTLGATVCPKCGRFIPDAGARRRVTLILDVQDDVAMLQTDILRAVKIGRPDLYERILSSSCAVADA